MIQTREPAVAGMFYPDQAAALTANLTQLLGDAIRAPAMATGNNASGAPKAIIVPHAGYIYSGATAALAYATLRGMRQTVRRVVLLGPVHQVSVRGIALPGCARFVTALGEIAIDQAAIASIRHLPQVVESVAAHAREHALEVQLPFLQQVLDDFTLLPLAVGHASATEVAQVLDLLWGGPETLIVISSDLSHFLPYEQAQTVDRETTQQILDLRPTLNHEQACGATPINGLLMAAQRHRMQPRLLGLCNSGDTAGDRQRVVGYASFAFSTGPATAGQAKEQGEDDDNGAVLLAIARAAIALALDREASAAIHAPWLQETGATFVTLTQNGALRGCIGSLMAQRRLLDDVQANARAAALKDPRFAPLRRDELDHTTISVSLLSELQDMSFRDEADALAQLRPGIDGLVFACAGRRSTFLPQVWEQLASPREFLCQLRRKAGLAEDFWSSEVVLQRYTVAKWEESPPSKAARTGISGFAFQARERP